MSGAEMGLGALVLWTLVKIVFILGVAVGVFAPVLVWAERRQSAMIQDRVGPHRAGFRIFGRYVSLAGLLHPLADAMKMIWKEDFVPPKADRVLHALAPIVSLVPAIAAFAVIPFGDVLYLDYWDQWIPSEGFIGGPRVPLQVASLDVGILFLLAVTGTGIVGAAVGGYASDNKYSLLGGLRAASQMVSYEVALGLTLVGAFMVYDTLRLEEMVHWQAEHVWGVLVQPLGFVLYLTAAIAETKRVPFDLPEGESEIVGGYFTEYSGMKFGMFFMGEFIEVVLLAAVAVTIFFGGWDVPFLERGGFELLGWQLPMVHGAVVALQVLAFVVKVALLVWLQQQIRWTLPRFRYDQLMALCWKLLLPLSLVNILGTGLVLLLVG